MNIIFVSIPISIVLLALGVWAFFWAVRTGQYEDLDSPAYSILDEDRPKKQRNQANQTTTDDGPRNPGES